MTSFDHRDRVFAIGLSMLAGFVDSVGFLATGGFFVSFMSGNTTRLGVGLAAGSSGALIALGLIVVFVAGVTAGSLIGRFVSRHRRSTLLATITAALAGAALLGDLGMVWGAIAATALAMGMENTVFEQDGEVRIGLTYMTGRLVKIGQRLAVAITGEDVWGWVPHMLLWLGLLAGGAAGALTHALLGLDALWPAAAIAAFLTGAAALLEPPAGEGPG